MNRRSSGRGGRATVAGLAGWAALLASLQLFTIGLGLAGVGLTQPLAALGLAVAAALAMAFALQFVRPGSLPPVPSGEDGSPEPSRAARLGAGFVGLAALGFAGWIWIGLLRIALSRDPIGWDGLWYHVPAIHAWSRQGGVGFITTLPDVPLANGPMAVEATSFFLYRLLGTDRLLDAGNLWFWPLAVAAIAVLTRLLGARGPWPWVAGALVATCPVWLGLSATAYVDPGLAASVMAAIAAGALFADPASSRSGLVAALFGLTLGLGLGAKVTGLPYVGVIGLVAAAGRLRVVGLGAWRRWLAPLALVAAAALLVGGYWYLRNLVVTGNPLYPFQIAFGARVVVPGWDHSYFDQLGVPGWMVPVPAVARPLLAWWRGDAPSPDYMFSAAGLGWIWVLGGVPAVAVAWWLALRRSPAVRTPALAYLTVIVVILLAISPIPWRSRLTIWLLALGLPVLGAVLHDAARRWRHPWPNGLILLLGALVVALAVGDAGRVMREERARTPAASPRYRSAMDLHFPGLTTTPGFDRLLAEPRIARGRWVTDYGTLLGGVLALPVGRREIVVIPPSRGDYHDPYADASVRRDPTPADLEQLIAAGIHWLIWDARPQDGLPAVLEPFTAARFEYDHPGAGNVIYAIRLRAGGSAVESDR